MQITSVIIILLIVVVVWCVIMKTQRTQCNEGLSGYGVTSALAFNNRMAYCQPGNDRYGGAWSGGCFLPHRVIL